MLALSGDSLDGVQTSHCPPLPGHKWLPPTKSILNSYTCTRVS
jgi:hypothetical protein